MPKQVAYSWGTRKRENKVADNVKMYVKKTIKSMEEKGHVLKSGNVTEITSTMDVIDLSDTITQGDGDSQRQGDGIRVDYLEGHLHVIRDSTATTGTYDRLRLLILQWKGNDADWDPETEATATQFYERAVSMSPLTANLADRKMFKVLWDSQCFILGEHSDSLRSDRFFKVKIPGKRIAPVRYNAGAVTGSNKIFLVTYGLQATGTENSVVTYELLQHFRS